MCLFTSCLIFCLLFVLSRSLDIALVLTSCINIFTACQNFNWYQSRHPVLFLVNLQGIYFLVLWAGKEDKLTDHLFLMGPTIITGKYADESIISVFYILFKFILFRFYMFLFPFQSYFTSIASYFISGTKISKISSWSKRKVIWSLFVPKI